MKISLHVKSFKIIHAISLKQFTVIKREIEILKMLNY